MTLTPTPEALRGMSTAVYAMTGETVMEGVPALNVLDVQGMSPRLDDALP